MAAPKTDGLDAREAALAHAIYDSAVRRWLTLAYLVQACSGRPWTELEPRMQGVFLGASTQLLLMDRIPAHAAIDEAVNWAKEHIRPGAGAMVNAVLRNLARLRSPREDDVRDRREQWNDRRDEIPLAEGGALGLAGAVLPEDAVSRLAVATSHPRWLLERWGRAWRDEPQRVGMLALHGIVSPPVVLTTAYALSNVEHPLLVPHELPGHHVFVGGGPDGGQLDRLLARRRDIWVQDAASAVPVAAAGEDDFEPRLIVDLCAGRGTKTRQLAAVFPSSDILATDIEAERFADLTRLFAGAARVRVMEIDRVMAQAAGAADLVLLDVPCSNTGVLARRVEARYRADGAALERLTATQDEIVRSAAGLLSPRGRLLYATCSMEDEENTAQAESAAKVIGGTIMRSGVHLPRGGPGEPETAYTDASFHALIAR